MRLIPATSVSGKGVMINPMSVSYLTEAADGQRCSIHFVGSNDSSLLVKESMAELAPKFASSQ